MLDHAIQQEIKKDCSGVAIIITTPSTAQQPTQPHDTKLNRIWKMIYLMIAMAEKKSLPWTGLYKIALKSNEPYPTLLYLMKEPMIAMARRSEPRTAFYNTLLDATVVNSTGLYSTVLCCISKQIIKVQWLHGPLQKLGTRYWTTRYWTRQNFTELRAGLLDYT